MSALQDFQAIRDRHYLPPDEFRQALHNDPDVIREEEYFYLNRLAITESQITSEVKEWVQQWKDSHWSGSEQNDWEKLLIEIIGPLTPAARSEILLTLKENLRPEFIQTLSESVRDQILGREKKPASRKFVPWILFAAGLILVAGSQYLFPEILLPLGALSLLTGAVWLFLKS